MQTSTITDVINHIALVLDASGSMSSHQNNLIRVADEQVTYLAKRSQELDQETRVSIYTFDDVVKCVVFDKDVLRLPSIRDLYRIGGQTALIGATLKSQQDLAQTAQLYGNHAFLTFVLTDGEENVARHRANELKAFLANQPENWTVAVLVPSQRSVFEAKTYGFPAGNITTWDTNSSTGIEEAASVIQTATNTYMTSRSQAPTTYRGSKTMFSTGATVLNKQTVQAANLVPMDPAKYMLVPVTHDVVIKDFVTGDCNRPWMLGKYMYELVIRPGRREIIQGTKLIAVLETATHKVYTGSDARGLIGLGDDTVTVKPDANPAYKVFVQSTSNNRILRAGTRLLILE